MSATGHDWDKAIRSARARRAAAMKTTGVTAGMRVSYRSRPADATTWTGIVVDGGCGDKSCGFIHVKTDEGCLHHVSADDIARAMPKT